VSRSYQQSTGGKVRSDLPPKEYLTQEQLTSAGKLLKPNYEAIKAHPAVFDIAETGSERGYNQWIVSLKYGYDLDSDTSFGAKNFSDAVKQLKKITRTPTEDLRPG